MIRYVHINNLILNIYKKLPFISFPIDLEFVIRYINNCKYMSYQDFANINNCSIQDVIQICESKSGCTHYDISQNRYLILCNQSISDNNNLGRQRWTFGHEIGHVVCNHHTISTYEKLSENSLLKIKNAEYEREADYFAATILSPFPLFGILDVNSDLDIQRIFGLSAEASIYRFNQYHKWLATRRKTSWENDIRRLYQQKGI